MQLILRVAVKPFVKKYIAQEYSVDPFVLTTTNKYGIFLYHCLSKPEKNVLRLVESNPVDMSLFTDTLEVMVTEGRWLNKGCIFTPESQMHFNKFVSYDFHQEFFKYVKNRVGAKGSINKAILSFREMNGLSEDDLPFRTIQRAFQRRNEKIKSTLSA